MADISNVISASLIAAGRLAGRSNLNVVSIITSETGVLSSNERYRIYRNAGAVAQDFGSASAVTQHANAFFGTQPNAAQSGGYLVVGFHRAEEETTPDTAATLKSAELDKDSVLTELRQITDGSFDIDVDGTTVSASALDFSGAATFDDVVSTINTAVTGATVSQDELGIVITSDTSGATSTLTYATDSGSGTFIGNLLEITDGSGAELTQGEASGTLPAESQLDAITELKALTGMFGATFIDTLTDAPAIASWAQANSVLVYNVFTGSDALQVDSSNEVWEITLSSYTNFRMIWRKDGNRKAATSYMARAHTVNFSASNSTLTMNLKTLSVPAEDLTETEITQAKRVGLDVYVPIKDVPVVLCSGANDYVDNRYNLIGYVDAIQTDTFNFLKAAGTKIPQTTQGVNSIVDSVEKTTSGFVNNGAFAPGEWTRPDTFGDPETFKRAVREKGFYVLAGRLSDQPASERQERKSPPIQVAVKNAGAIHSADIIIQFDE